MGEKRQFSFVGKIDFFCKLPYLENGTGNSLVFHIDKKTFLEIIFNSSAAELDFEKILRSDPDFKFRRTQ